MTGSQFSISVYIFTTAFTVIRKIANKISKPATCLVRVAEDGLLLVGPGAVSHPHRDGEGILQVGADGAVGDLDGLCAVELKHLVAVVAVVGGEADGPVGGAAGRRQELHGARARSYKEHFSKNLGKRQTLKGQL